MSPCQFALGAGATFVARGVDIDQKGLPSLLNAAREHAGTGFVEILQNCIVYNADVFDDVVAKKTAAETQIHVQHGAPLVYGKARDKGLRLDARTLRLESVTLGENGVSEADLLVHDETNPIIGQLLAGLRAPFPVAMGILHRRTAPAYDQTFREHKPALRKQRIKQLLHRGNILDRR